MQCVCYMAAFFFFFEFILFFFLTYIHERSRSANLSEFYLRYWKFSVCSTSDLVGHRKSFS